MDNLGKVWLSVLTIAVLVVGWVALNASPTNIFNEDGNLGALSSPDINSPYISYGSVRHWAGHTESLKQATTTICALQSPTGTSTLTYASLRLTNSSTTATVTTMAKAATAYATTTYLESGSAAANGLMFLALPATTTSAGMAKQIFGPSEYLVFGMQGGVGTFSPSGVCEATWVESY